MTIKVCVSLPPKTLDEASRLIEKADAQNADLIEVRLDSLKTVDNLKNITHNSKTPLIATNKSTKNHGKYSGSEEDRQRILKDAARNGFQYVDVDLSTPNMKKLINYLRKVGAKPIISFHDFNQTPTLSKLTNIFRQETAAGADICKIVTTANHVKDNLTILEFISKASKNAKIVCFAMGELGKLSRLLSPIFGAFFTFASINDEKKTANGQLTLQEMRRAYEVLGLK